MELKIEERTIEWYIKNMVSIQDGTLELDKESITKKIDEFGEFSWDSLLNKYNITNYRLVSSEQLEEYFRYPENNFSLIYHNPKNKIIGFYYDSTIDDSLDDVWFNIGKITRFILNSIFIDIGYEIYLEDPKKYKDYDKSTWINSIQIIFEKILKNSNEVYLIKRSNISDFSFKKVNLESVWQGYFHSDLLETSRWDLDGCSLVYRDNKRLKYNKFTFVSSIGIGKDLTKLIINEKYKKVLIEEKWKEKDKIEKRIKNFQKSLEKNKKSLKDLEQELFFLESGILDQSINTDNL